jgi:transposase-like protein
MARRKRRKFTPEFKAEAVRFARAGDRSIRQVAENLDLTESALRNWLKQSVVDAGQGPPDGSRRQRKASSPTCGARSNGSDRNVTF